MNLGLRSGSVREMPVWGQLPSAVRSRLRAGGCNIVPYQPVLIHDLSALAGVKTMCNGIPCGYVDAHSYGMLLLKPSRQTTQKI